MFQIQFFRIFSVLLKALEKSLRFWRSWPSVLELTFTEQRSYFRLSQFRASNDQTGISEILQKFYQQFEISQLV